MLSTGSSVLVESVIRYTAATHCTLDICIPTLARVYMMYLSLLSLVLSWGNYGCYGVILLRRDLTSYPLARCNDGSAAAYYHEKVVYFDVLKFQTYWYDGLERNSFFTEIKQNYQPRAPQSRTEKCCPV